MKRLATLVCTVLALALSMASSAAEYPGTGDSPDQESLFDTVSKLDASFFDTFNHCASPEQLQKHADYLVPNLEFYHDNGGVTWSRQDYLANTERNVCGQFRRELIAGSLQVFPVKDFGAIEQGKQKFCWLKTGKCFGQAQFLILWQHQDTRWVITRVFSYGHLPIE